MADSDLGELYGTASPPRGVVQAWFGLMGTATSLALIAGVCIWGYKLVMRDVHGIPVIQALAGPMRIQPKDPGGEQMAFQGLAVNQVAADGEAGEISEKVTLAPPAPELREHDLPRDELTAAPIPNFTRATDDAVAAALEEIEGEGDAEEPGDTTVAELAASAEPVVGVIAASVPGVHKSPRPHARPEALQLAAAVVEPASAPAAEEVDASKLPAGARLVQLGAFDTPETARSEWGKVAVSYPDVMAGKQRVIQKASAGGQTFYRLRVAGFTDLADARRFCATLAAGRAAPLCVPVAVR